uniref:Variant surface glycoprotein 1125.2756 n=1 Tax=Trypanosoma brucei TaxID=5691 RepID=A0A1J0R8G5_9TRYP|nr:variant surface glycoprotein 1125.2756 [Trypanosoma brucei]
MTAESVKVRKAIEKVLSLTEYKVILMTQGASLLAVLMLLGGAVSQVVEATYKMSLMSTGWQPLCEIGAALVAKSAQAAAVSEAQRNRASNLLQQQLRAEIAASTVDDEETEKRFFTIAFYLKHEAAKALKDLAAPGETANTKAVRTTNFTLCYIIELMVIATGGTTSGKAGCISKNTTEGSDPVLRYSKLVSAYGNFAALEGSPITGFDPSTVLDNKGLKAITTAGGNSIAATEKHCRLLTTAANEGYADDDTAEGTVNMAGGLLKVTSNAAVNFNAHNTLTGAAAAETKNYESGVQMRSKKYQLSPKTTPTKTLTNSKQPLTFRNRSNPFTTSSKQKRESLWKWK